MFDRRSGYIQILDFAEEYADDVAQLFHQAVHAIDSSVYTERQKQAWAPTPPDYPVWRSRLNRTQPFLAMLDGQIVGFMEWDSGGHIDCVYTHPDHQRQGVATALFDYLLAEAQAAGVSRLYLEASLLAKAFFAARGFRLVSKNLVNRRAVELTNYSMERYL